MGDSTGQTEFATPDTSVRTQSYLETEGCGKISRTRMDSGWLGNRGCGKISRTRMDSG